MYKNAEYYEDPECSVNKKSPDSHNEPGPVASTGVEPVTHGFSVRCSTN